jgi:hypothetical protein
MDEKNLLQFWNQQRSQIIAAQLAPALVLLGILALASLGLFEDATKQVQYLALGVAISTGILAVISQFAAIREGEALARDLQTVDNPSHLAQKVSGSGGLLSLTTFAIVGISLAIYALVIYAILY